MGYQELKYPKPDVFEGKHPKSKVLIIGSGPSTEDIVKYKDKLKDIFDVVMVLNYSFKFFDDYVDYHLVTEKSSKSSLNLVPVWMHKAKCNKKVPRIINWKGIERYPQDLNLHKLQRCPIGQKFNPRKYKSDGNEGLIVGPVSYQNFSVGSSMLCAMHFAMMIGASDIYLIGADMLFRDEYDHWYKDKFYREPAKGTKDINHHDIVEVECNGKTYQTTAYFKETAEFIDQVIPTLFRDAKVYDFSNGLLKMPKRLNTIDFFEANGVK